MSLYIQVNNDFAINHPALESTLIQAFGEIPSDWQSFKRVEPPKRGPYEILVSNEPTYQKIDGIWQDVWEVRNMTEQEKKEKQDVIKNSWAAREDLDNFLTWTFDEELCEYIPPIPKPDDGKSYEWSGKDNNWVEIVIPEVAQENPNI